jgi:excisionase family DNA binding protein
LHDARVQTAEISGILLRTPEIPLDPLALSYLPHFLEVSHAAHRLSVSQEFIRRLIRTGVLPAIRLGTRWRIHPREFEAYVERCQAASREKAAASSTVQAFPQRGA